nr:MAG TPA: repressor protein C2 [Caudoviricetes sp.]
MQRYIFNIVVANFKIVLTVSLTYIYTIINFYNIYVMKYQYNFGFLKQWLAANPQLQVKTIQAALGSKSNNSWKGWLNGEGTLPIISLLRLCNAFQIPLSAFFRNADSNGEAAVVPGIPTIDDELEPKGGFDRAPSERLPGEKSYLDPLDVEVCVTTIPGVTVRQDKKNAVEDEQEASDNKDDTALPANLGNMNSENLKSLIKLQMQHAAIESRYLDNQNRLLDIIAAQQNQIANLTRQLNNYELLKAREYGSDMVSDELNK